MIIQAVERLREDAQKLLLSRKRKLAELYDTTVCRNGRLQDPVNDLYFQQLQAFQDANDLQKGRLFIESSLPPRRELVRLSTPSNTTTSTTNSTQTTQRDGSNHKHESHQLKLPHESTTQSANGNAVAVLSPPSSPKPNTSSRATPVPHPETTVTSIPSKIIHQPETEPSVTHLATQPNIAANGLPETDNADANGNLQASTSQAKKERPFPTSTQTHDVHSSPASSTGPSSHTPGPDAASPTTSPGDDIAPTLEIMNMKAPEPRRDEPQTPDMIAAPTHKMSISSIDVEMIDVDPSAAFDSPVQPSKHPPTPSKESTTTKPAISVDTQSDHKSYFDSRPGSTIVETPGQISGQAISRRTSIATPAVDSARRATRIQSGALQKKSVSEILGETPRSNSPNNEQALTASARAIEKDRKERSRLSTVVFAKPQRPVTDPDTIEVARADQSLKSTTQQGDRDYMYTLFESKAHSQNRQGTLPYLLQHSHKTLSTTDHLVDYHYQAHCRVLKRLYQLQNLDRWSLRQRKRAEEPARSTSHWDFLLDHAKWMRTDFREERRWKLAAAMALAEACAEWVAATPEQRRALQVQIRPTISHGEIDMADDQFDQSISSPPGLEPHGEDDSVSEDIADPREIVSTVAPAAIFSLGATDFTFATEKTPALDKLLNELPLYQPAKIEPDLAKSNLAEKLDARWKTDIVQVSRYATEKLKVKEYTPPIKRSRYDYNVDDSPPSKRQALEPRETEVALFMPENKHIRDRIHPGHAFRPPAEHPMPSQAFFETRMSSQWLASEDDEVRRQAREYSFNWTLISEIMAPPTLYNSGQDRRTAWECFERWIGLEGMPADMAKTPYFKTYSSRIETAQRNVQSQWEEHERRNGTTPVSNRRKTTLPIRVERKHNRRHLFMLDAMRKLAKKREAVRQKAMQSADIAAMRKNNDVHAPRPGMKTPAEWSQLKYEREQKMAKQQEMYKQQLIAHQRLVVQQQRGGQNPPANGVPVPPNTTNQMRMPGPNGQPMPNGHLQAPNGQSRPHPNMMGMPQNMPLPAGMVGPNNMPQPIPGAGRGTAGSPQQMKNLQQAAMANGQGMDNPALMNMNQPTGQGSPSNNVNHPTARPQSSHLPQSLSSGNMPKINQLYASIRANNPTMSDEDVKNVATQQLIQWQATARPKVNQAALNAALGAANSGAYAATQNQNAMNMNQGVNTSGQGMMSYEQAQQYHQRMRMQQAQQNAARGMPAPGNVVGPAGMTASPVMNMARPVSQHSQNGMSVNSGRGSATPVPARDQRSVSAATTNLNTTHAANVGQIQTAGQVHNQGLNTVGGQQNGQIQGQPPVAAAAAPPPSVPPQSSPAPPAPAPTPASMQT